MSSHQHLIGRLFQVAKSVPTRPALVTAQQTLSYTQLANLVCLQAGILEKEGVTGKSVVGIQCADDIRHLVLCLAASALGSTSFTVPTHESPETRALVAKRCGATQVFDASKAIDPRLGDDDGDGKLITPADDSCLLFSTSGTTGDPKLVMLNASDLVAQALRHVNTSDERFACLASMEQNFAKRHRLYCLAVGATNLFPTADYSSLVEQCLELQVNVLHVSAFQAKELLSVPDIGKLSHLRLKLGGSHVPLVLRKQLKQGITANLQAGYGTTETGAIGFTDADDQDAGESVGRALPGINVRIVNADRHSVAQGERGEIAIDCEGMFRGYLGNSALTDKKLQDGWFYTGDLGYLDDDGRIHLCGRSDDMFMFNSMNIYPQDIESVICAYPTVRDAVVFSQQSPAHGNIPMALVVFKEDVKADLRGLEKYVRNQVGVRHPRRYTEVTNIPRNSQGKILRNQVSGIGAQVDTVRKTMTRVLKQNCNLDSRTIRLLDSFERGDKNIQLSQLRIDSLTRMELMVALEVGHDVIIMPHEFPELHSLEAIVSRAIRTQSEHLESTDSHFRMTNNAFHLQGYEGTPQIVKIFQRVFRYCFTAAHLNKVLTTLENRLTPRDWQLLFSWHEQGKLLPSDAGEKFHSTFSHWVQRMCVLMSGCEKSMPEPFQRHRIQYGLNYFRGPGGKQDKTLLICFSSRGGHSLMIPNFIFAQYANARQVDLLIVSEPLGVNYQKGVPGLGSNLTAVIKTLSKLDEVSGYERIRTLGCSAGGYAAIQAGDLLGAEIAVSISGRLIHKHQAPLVYLKRLGILWLSGIKNRCPKVIVSYASDSGRDRKFARIVSRLINVELHKVNPESEKIGHNLPDYLAVRGELGGFFNRTIYRGIVD